MSDKAESGGIVLTDAERSGGWYEDGVWCASEALVLGIVRTRVARALQQIDALIAKYERRATLPTARYVRAQDVVTDLQGLRTPSGEQS